MIKGWHLSEEENIRRSVYLKEYYKTHKHHQIGKTSPMDGRKHTKESLAKMSLIHKGVKLTDEHKKKLSIKSKGFKHSQETINRLKDRHGEKNPNWKGGLSVNPSWKSHYSKQRQARVRGAKGTHTLYEWELLKKQYGFTCPCCKLSQPEIILVKDHIIPITKGGSNFIENIQPLCGKCNRVKFTKSTKYYLEVEIERPQV